MLSPEAFRDEYDDDETLAEELPDSPVTSLRDIQYLYGKLYTLGTTGEGEYAPYLTPDSAADLVDTDQSLIVVRVDLRSDHPPLADDDRGPVWVTRLEEDHVQKVAHCKYQAARGIDHSITHQSGSNSSSEKLARYAGERLTKWPRDDIVQGVAEDHDQGRVIEKLEALGEREDIIEQVEDQVERELGGEQTTALLTVKVRLDDGEYHWPGDLDVFLAAMRERKLSKLVTKNKADNSAGQATDIVTGDSTRTVGTAEDPQNYFLGKQRETFPGLDIEEAWRSHPIAEDSAVTVMNAETFVNACSYRTLGARVYYLPYLFGNVSPEDARDLYELLYQAATADDDMTPVELAYSEFKHIRDEEFPLRFFVSAVLPHQMSRYDVFGETLSGRLLYPVELAESHNRIVSMASAFHANGEWTTPLPVHENWDLLAARANQLHPISTGWYFAQTFAERDDSESDAEDPRIRSLVEVLSGGAIEVETLLGEYVDRISADQRSDDVDDFPSFRVASQFAQLCALAGEEVELLRTDDPGKVPITREPTYDFETMNSQSEATAADGGHPAEVKLESFIEDTSAIASDGQSPINDQRRGAFLLGALVGEVGSYQGYREQRSTTLVDQFPVKSITRARIKKITQETIGKTLTYTRKEGRTITLFEHVVESLRETILQADPDTWEIDTDDLRFYYALGVTYGMNDHPDWDQPTAEEEES